MVVLSLSPHRSSVMFDLLHSRSEFWHLPGWQTLCLFALVQQQFSVKHRVLIYQGVEGIEATIFRNVLVL